MQYCGKDAAIPKLPESTVRDCSAWLACFWLERFPERAPSQKDSEKDVSADRATTGLRQTRSLGCMYFF